MIEELWFSKTPLSPCQWLSLASDGHVKHLLLNVRGAICTVVREYCPLRSIERELVKSIISGGKKKYRLLVALAKVV